ncbi:MAG: hypothetical protein U5M23_05760 [Marinagarivorans sp.]|nr:hypothetical protein [Marinagarivorans sp.]
MMNTPIIISGGPRIILLHGDVITPITYQHRALLFGKEGGRFEQAQDLELR